VAYNAEQQKNINLILSIVKKRGLPPQAAQIALMTAMVEAGLEDHSGPSTDHDSGGLFQQRPSAGWGTYQQVRDPVYATNKFLDHLTAIQGWQTMQPGAAAQAVQGSAFPDRYQEHFGEAASILQSAWAGSKPYAGDMSQSTGGAGAVPMTAPTLTPAQLKASMIAGMGPLAGLLTAIPELKNLLDQAVSQGLTAPEFQNLINNSAWYRTHNDTVRQAIAQQASDPTTYAKMLKQEQAKITSLAHQMGVNLTPQQLATLGTQSYWQGYTQDQLTAQLAGMFNQKGQLGGQAAQIHDDLAKSAALYGQNWTDQQIRYRTQQVLANPGMLDTYKESMKTAAKAMYPGLSSQIDAGLTVEDVASPYKQTMANLLEVDPATLTLNDRMIKSALQGTGNVAKGQQPTATPVWQFEQQVRSDPRWQLTNNARQDTAATLESLGKQWGLSAA
jgi:hypothetical protein